MQRQDKHTAEDNQGSAQKQSAIPHSYDVRRVEVPARFVTSRALSADRELHSGRKQNALRQKRLKRSSLSMGSTPNRSVENETSMGLVVMATQNRGSAGRLLTSRSRSDLVRLRNDHREVDVMTILSRSSSTESKQTGMLVLDKSEMDGLDIPPHFSFGSNSSLADTAAVNGGAIFSFSDKKKDEFNIKTAASGSPHRHRKERRKKAKHAKFPSNSIHPVDGSDGRQLSAPRHGDNFHSNKLQPLFEANASNGLQTPNERHISGTGSGDRANGNGRKDKEKKHTLPPIVIKQFQRRHPSSFVPGMYPEVAFTYTPGANGPLSGILGQTSPLSAVQTPSVSTPGLLTPIRTRSVRVDSTFEEHENQMVRQYFPDMTVKIFIGTWNMHEQKEVLDRLDDLLLPADIEMLQDIYVIGVQECYMDKHDWDVKLQETLGPLQVLAYSCRQGCLQLSVFIRRDLIWFCCGFVDSNVITTFKPASLIKTKGGLAVAFSIFGTSLLFINSHLSAHEEKMLVRHAEVSKICQSLAIPKGGSYGPTADVTYRYDCVFWFGDLNYRCEAEREEMDRLLRRGDIHGALLKDQLAKEMEKGNVFSGFSEQPIAFFPTYKFDPNSNDYDTSEKHRTQSWTDRILFKSRYGKAISGHQYDSCNSVLSSDHRPVYAVFHAMLQATEDISLPDAPVRFDRSVYSEGNARRRARRLPSSPASQTSGDSKSAICTIL